MIAILQFIGLVVSFAVAGWARLKLKSRWVKVLFFFVAVIAGNVVYLGLGVIWAMADRRRCTPRLARSGSMDGKFWAAQLPRLSQDWSSRWSTE